MHSLSPAVYKTVQISTLLGTTNQVIGLLQQQGKLVQSAPSGLMYQWDQMSGVLYGALVLQEENLR